MNIAKFRQSSLTSSDVYRMGTLTRPHSSAEAVRRFLVLVPSVEIDLSVAAKRLWELANATGAHIQFLSLYNDPERESSLRRVLTTLSTMVKDERISVSAEVIFEKNWGNVVNAFTQNVDMVVCFPEKRKSKHQKLLNQILQINPDIPLYIFSDPSIEKTRNSELLAQIAVWAGFLSILVLFFVFQAQIIHISPDWLRTLLLVSSTMVEFGIIWLLNYLL